MLTLTNNLMATGAACALQGNYGKLSTSVRRLSSGLRVGMAADDAAGMAIRELMRSDIAAHNQGVRNANDAISLIQTTDGALQVIDEKLIRMKELAEQAATGTYDSVQRLLIHKEFQAMGAEIERIAHATDFNGVKLLNGSLSGTHNGSGLTSTGHVKVHFGSGNDSAEDYYYIQGGDITLTGLGLNDPASGTHIGGIAILSELIPNDANSVTKFTSGIVSFAIIPKGSKNVEIFINDYSQNDTLQLFTRDGKHLAGTTVTKNPHSHLTQSDWGSASNRVYSEADMNAKVITESNAFLPGAVYDSQYLHGTGLDIDNADYDLNSLNTFTHNGMTIGYSGDANTANKHHEKLVIDEATEDLVFMVVGQGVFDATASWSDMPPLANNGGGVGATQAISIKSQTEAQRALTAVDDAIVIKDNYRAYLGSTQNRLENTITNLQIQSENLQASESRISDTDVATEMTQFVRYQVLSSAATAMLSQANSLPNTLAQLLG